MGRMGKKVSTKIIHIGSSPNLHHGSINDPIYRNSTLIFENYNSFVSSKKKKFSSPYYGRLSTYTSRRFEKVVKQLYSAESSVITSSGLSAITISLMSFLNINDELLIVENCYEPVSNFANSLLSKFGVKTKYYNTNNFKEFTKMVNKKTKLIYLESPGSLNFEVQDIEKFTNFAKKNGIITIMDNTWSTFLGCNPLKFGVDIVIESCTKYFSGHSDTFCGLIVCSKKFHNQLKQTAVQLGDYVSPDSCFYALRGLKTLKVRLDQHQKNAENVYNFLKQEKIVDKIFYLPDQSNIYHKLWKKYHSLNNGLITFSLKKKGDQQKFLDGLNYFKIGFSWGGYESLIIPIDCLKPSINTSKNTKYWFRIHVGLESHNDLVYDLKNGLKKYEK